MNKKQVLKKLLQFAKQFTNYGDEIIYEKQEGTNPIRDAEEFLESL